MKTMRLVDSHVHTWNSHDCHQSIDEFCTAAIEKGVQGIAFTDHADMWYYKKRDTYACIQNSIADAAAAREKYKKHLSVFTGIELAEYLYDRDGGDKLLGLTEYDVVLGSSHCTKTPEWEDAYSDISFGDQMPEEQIYRFLDIYFDDVRAMAEWGGFDVLCHLTCPLRYINGKYQRNIDVWRMEAKIIGILETIIRKDIALEVNTSALYCPQFMIPDLKTLKRYRELGGRLITLGSDAHASRNVANGFDGVMDILREAGFKAYYYFRKREPQEIAL